jgi:hypothetical protein
MLPSPEFSFHIDTLGTEIDGRCHWQLEVFNLILRRSYIPSIRHYIVKSASETYVNRVRLEHGGIAVSAQPLVDLSQFHFVNAFGNVNWQSSCIQVVCQRLLRIV